MKHRLTTAAGPWSRQALCTVPDVCPLSRAWTRRGDSSDCDPPRRVTITPNYFLCGIRDKHAYLVDAFVRHTLKYSSERQKSGLQTFDSSYKTKRGLEAVGSNPQDRTVRYGCRFRVYGVHTVYDSNVTSINVMCTSMINGMCATLGVPVDCCCRSKPRRTCQRRPRAGGVSKNDARLHHNDIAKAVTQEKLQWGAEMHNVHWHAHGHVLRLSSSGSLPDVSSGVFHCSRIGRQRTQ